MNNFGDKNLETHDAQAENAVVNKQIERTKNTLIAAMKIDITKNMTKEKREKVENMIQNVNDGKIKSISELAAKGYQRVDLISTKEGFRLEKIIDENGEIKWHETSIPTYAHNFLDKKVIIGPYEDDGVPASDPNKIFALYIIEKKNKN